MISHPCTSLPLHCGLDLQICFYGIECCRSCGMWLLKLGYARDCSFHLGCYWSLSWITHSGGSQLRFWGAALWRAHEGQMPASNHPSELGSRSSLPELRLQVRSQPQLTAWLQPHEDLCHRQPAKLCLDSWPMETDNKCFKSFSFGVICSTATDK